MTRKTSRALNQSALPNRRKRGPSVESFSFALTRMSPNNQFEGLSRRQRHEIPRATQQLARIADTFHLTLCNTHTRILLSRVGPAHQSTSGTLMHDKASTNCPQSHFRVLLCSHVFSVAFRSHRLDRRVWFVFLVERICASRPLAVLVVLATTMTAWMPLLLSGISELFLWATSDFQRRGMSRCCRRALSFFVQVFMVSL